MDRTSLVSDDKRSRDSPASHNQSNLIYLFSLSSRTVFEIIRKMSHFYAGGVNFGISKLGKLGEMCFKMLNLGELGEMSFGILMVGELSELSFGTLKLGETSFETLKLGEMSFGTLYLGELGEL